MDWTLNGNISTPFGTGREPQHTVSPSRNLGIKGRRAFGGDRKWFIHLLRRWAPASQADWQAGWPRLRFPVGWSSPAGVTGLPVQVRLDQPSQNFNGPLLGVAFVGNRRFGEWHYSVESGGMRQAGAVRWGWFCSQEAQ